MSSGVFPLMSGASTFTPWSNRNFRILVREEKKKAILVKEEKKKAILVREEKKKAILVREEKKKAILVREEKKKISGVYTSNRKKDWKKVP